MIREHFIENRDITFDCHFSITKISLYVTAIIKTASVKTDFEWDSTHSLTKYLKKSEAMLLVTRRSKPETPSLDHSATKTQQ